MTTYRKEETKIPAPAVTIDRMVLERIRRYVGQCSTEISGFGFATVSDGKMHIIDARVVKQDAVSGAHTDINKDALNALMYEWRNLNGILVWWHSHVNMGTEWSSLDRATIMDLGKHYMCLAMVFNKRQEQRCALAFKAELPFLDNPQVLMIDDIPVSTAIEVPAETIAAWDKELAEALPPPSKFNPLYSDRWDDWGHGPRGDLTILNSAAGWDPSDFWEDAKQGEKEDCDWKHGSHWIDSQGKWLKSWSQRKKEAAAREAAKPAVVPTVSDGAIHEARLAVAREDEDIISYDALKDEYELIGGVIVDAEWYWKAADGMGMSESDIDDLYNYIEKERETADAKH